MVLVLPLKTVVISVSFHNCVKRPAAMIMALVVPLNQFTTTVCLIAVSLIIFGLFRQRHRAEDSFEVSLSERFAEFRRDEFNSSGKRRRQLLPRSIMGFATYMVH